MNQKAEAMGLTNTHFVNASGLHDPDHYSTPHEIALILEYALDIPKLREIISTYQYTTAKTEQHPDGLLLTSTVFSRMRGDAPGNAEVFAGKPVTRTRQKAASPVLPRRRTGTSMCW